jgi:hypothetical protein
MTHLHKTTETKYNTNQQTTATTTTTTTTAIPREGVPLLRELIVTRLVKAVPTALAVAGH